jgi:hypothetical protein
MSLHNRLERLERLAGPAADDAEREPESRQWLAVLKLLNKGMDPPGALDGAVALLAEYVVSGKVGAHTEYHCGARMHVMAGWAWAEQGDPRFDATLPVDGEEDRLQQCLQIDAWAAAGAAPSAGR